MHRRGKSEGGRLPERTGSSKSEKASKVNKIWKKNLQSCKLELVWHTINLISFHWPLRFHCGRGCSASYASKSYVQAKIHANDCPTMAFLASNWRPSSKSWLVDQGFFVRHDHVVNEQSDCVCGSGQPCHAIHLLEWFVALRHCGAFFTVLFRSCFVNYCSLTTPMLPIFLRKFHFGNWKKLKKDLKEDSYTTRS